jgi:hypothetical protein
MELAESANAKYRQGRTLCLRGCHLAESIWLNDLKTLVQEMPNLNYLDVSYNYLGGPRFFAWLCDWLRCDPQRTVAVCGTPFATEVQDAAEKEGLKGQVMI